MRKLLNLNTSLYLLLIGFTIYFSIIKIDELKGKRDALASQRESVRTDSANYVYPLVGEDLSGKPLTIQFRDQQIPSVVYVFSPNCHYCELNEANFSKILANGRATHRFIGVATVTLGLKEYVAQKGMDFPILVNPKRDHWKLAQTPQMVTVSAEGRLLHNWVGLEDRKRWELEQYFGLQLPGPVTPAPKYTAQP